MSVNYRPYTVPLASGLNTKPDKRALPAPGLAVAKDVEFEDVGGIQTRKPYDPVPDEIVGGVAVADMRRVVAHGDELLLFSKDALYTWSERDAAWVERGTYLAPKVTEREVFVNQHEQVDTDRAELGGTILFSWADDESSVSGRQAYVAAIDSTTGAVLLAPTSLGSGTDRPRLMVATTKVLLFWSQDDDLVVIALDPSDLTTSLTSGLASPTVVFTALSDTITVYDVCPRGGGVTVAVARGDSSSSPYFVGLITEALAVTTTSKARTATAFAVAAIAGVGIYVIRSSGANILGDYLNSTTLADITVNVAVGAAATTPVNNIAVSFHNTANPGEGRAFWTSGQTTASTSYRTETNTFTRTLGAVGTQGILARRLALASRAFAHDGHSYVWLVFGGASYFTGSSTPSFRTSLQNTYFLFRGDGVLVAKAAPGVAGELPSVHLAGVQSLGSNRYAWGGKSQRRVPSNIGGRTDAYADHAPREVVVEFDSDEARRTAQLGRTLYITGGQIMQYDGIGVWEVGFHLFPFSMNVTSTAAGNIDTGTHAYKRTRRRQNGRGEVEESTTATVISHTNGGAAQEKTFSTMDTLYATLKGETIEDIVWRTLVNPTADAPFYRTNSLDPTDSSGDNAFLLNDQSSANLSYTDNLSDADLSLRETNYENGGILENLAPPPASIAIASADRLFLAGISGSPHQVRYSKLRGEGEVASFHDALTVQVPPAGGDITALAFLNETLIVFKESAIYALPGDGFDNFGGGTNYGPARLLSSDVGAVSHEAVALTPMGLVFKSLKGWYLLNRGWGCDYIGKEAAEFDSDTVKGIDVVETQHHVRILTDARMLIWDYSNKTESSPGGQWAEWTEPDGRSSTIWDGTHVYCTDAGIFEQCTDYTDTDYGLDTETAWIHPGGLMDYARCRRIQILGAYKSAHRLRVRMAFDHVEGTDGTPTWRVDKTITVSPATVGRLQEWVSIPGGWQKCEAIKVRITAVHATEDGQPPDGEALSLTALMLDIGFKKGGYMRLPVAQRQ